MMKIEFCDKILDNVHGFIDITDVERQIIELPIFKRLQHIKQLSLANWVFPGAEHTRYIHSLGVMHIADQMAMHLGYDADMRILVRLAGLLHDLGHYPLSHEGESAYMDMYDESEDFFKNNEGRIKRKIDKLDDIPSLARMQTASEYHHELITVEVIAYDRDIQRIIETTFGKHAIINLENICAIIVGNATNRQIGGLVQLMHSELDADRIDYLMRDATFSGTCYGGFELGLFLRNLKRTTYSGDEIIGISRKGIAMADQFLINRFFSYSQVVFNKHVSLLGKMVSSLIKKYRQRTKLASTTDLKAHIKEHCETSYYNEFTDIKFWTLLHSERNNIGDAFLNNIITALLENSEIGRCVNEKTIVSSDWKEMKKELQKTQMYGNLGAANPKKLHLLHQKKLTNQIPIVEYREQANIENYNVAGRDLRVFQEAIVVIDDEHSDEPTLLVDCQESLISQLYKTQLVILREYQI